MNWFSSEKELSPNLKHLRKTMKLNRSFSLLLESYQNVKFVGN